MRKLKALLAILSLLGIIFGCTEATTTEVITNDKKPEYKISFNANGGKGTMSDISIVAETSIILPENTFTRDNYTFMGWSTTGDGEVMFKNGAIFEGLYSDITLYAKWEKKVVPVVKITITFDVNGAGGTAPTAIETTPDKNVELPVLTNAKFSHWNTKADGSGQSYKTTATFTESVILYAILLAENAHTITYELDGGVNNTVNPFSFTEEDTVTLKNPTKNGYKFVGWYETADFSGSVVKGWFAGDKTANVILYAKWEKEATPVVKITITFDVNGAGGTAPAAIETTPDENVELPALTNAKFSHWNTKADGSGQSYNGTATFTESVTLYAILLAENAHTITYELNGGVNHPKNKYSFTEDDVVILREPTRENCIFVGWYESPDFSGEKIELWYEGYKTANVTLYAKWIVGYTITYELNGGINDSSNLSFFTEDDYSIHVYAPTRDGYRFCGWYETEDFTDSSISYFYTSENLRNIILYAKWEQIIPGIYLSGLYDLNDSAHWAADDNPGTAFAMTECENDVWTFTFTAENTEPFPFGFKFTTENGWQEQYQAYDKNNPTDDFAILQLDKEAGVYFATKAEVEAPDEDGNRIPDNATKFRLGVNNKFIVGVEYTITFDKANMKVKITGDFADMPTYTIEYVLTESWKSDFTPITKRCLGEEVELPTIENVDTEKDVASYILKWYTTETFETGTEIKNIEAGTEKDMKLYGKIEESYKTTADDFIQMIQSLPAGGPYNVIVTGELTESQLENIATCIKAYSTKKINLDLSETRGLTRIYGYTFSDCKSLISIKIPNGVNTILNDAFSGCTNLTNMIIPDSLTSISINYRAFYNCINLTNFNVSADNYNYSSLAGGKILCNKNKTTLLAYPSATGDVTIPDSVTSIGSYAFENCSSLESVTIPDSVTSIGNSAFSGCSSLTSVYITDLTVWNNIRFYNDNTNPLLNGAKLYLNGSLVEFTVTFDVTDGVWDDESGQTVISGEKAVKPTNPSKNGYIFQGWYTSADDGETLSDIAYNFDTIVIKDIKLYAKWDIVGSIAYSDGSISADYDNTKTPIGIVIEATDGVATKIVSLAETTAQWSTERVVTNATSETDGMANQTAIQAIDGWKEKYPAFKWCDDYTDASDNSEWYLPAKDELNLIYKVKDVINTAIDKITAGEGAVTSLDTDGYYWSSSQDISNFYAWHQRFSDGDQGNYNGYNYSVRAVRAF